MCAASTIVWLHSHFLYIFSINNHAPRHTLECSHKTHSVQVHNNSNNLFAIFTIIWHEPALESSQLFFSLHSFTLLIRWFYPKALIYRLFSLARLGRLKQIEREMKSDCVLCRNIFQYEYISKDRREIETETFTAIKAAWQRAHFKHQLFVGSIQTITAREKEVTNAMKQRQL